MITVIQQYLMVQSPTFMHENGHVVIVL